MIRSLRKGNTTVEVSHEFGEDSINAEEVEVELKDDHAVFRIKLKPVGKNQRDDIAAMFSPSIPSALKQLFFQDLKIRESTAEFMSAYSGRIEYLRLEVVYKRCHQFDIGLKPVGEDGLLFKIKT